MGYQRWVCTKCGSVAITTGRRPGPKDGLNEYGYSACIKYKNGDYQPHRWVKDGEATDEEVEEYARNLEYYQDLKKNIDSWSRTGDYTFSGCLGGFLTLIFLGIGGLCLLEGTTGDKENADEVMCVGGFFLFMAFLAYWKMYRHG